MLDAKTVFILGAGASSHYGYPSGEDLVRRVITKAEIAGRYFKEVLTNGGSALFNAVPKIISKNDSA